MLICQQAKAACQDADLVSTVIPLIDSVNRAIPDVGHVQTEPHLLRAQAAQMTVS